MWLSMLDGHLHQTCTSKISFSKLSLLPFVCFFWFFHLFFGFLCHSGVRKHEKSCSKPFQAISSKSDCIKISGKWSSASRPSRKCNFYLSLLFHAFRKQNLFSEANSLTFHYFPTFFVPISFKKHKKA